MKVNEESVDFFDKALDRVVCSNGGGGCCHLHPGDAGAYPVAPFESLGSPRRRNDAVELLNVARWFRFAPRGSPP